MKVSQTLTNPLDYGIMCVPIMSIRFISKKPVKVPVLHILEAKRSLYRLN